MKQRHFETLRPICPTCLLQGEGEFPLEIGWIAREQADSIEEGGLYCTHSECRLEFPIIDGMPVIVPDARAYLADHAFAFLLRDDLDPRIEGLLGECCGPGSALDATRVHLSSYAWDHYAGLDPEEPKDVPASPGSLLRAWSRLRGLAPAGPSGPVLDLGCAVGGLTFALAEESEELILGVDLNASMLRLARRVLRTGTVAYPRRRGGLLYEHRAFPLPPGFHDRVDFWVVDGLALPFPGETFSRVVSLNVVDSALSPLDLLRSAERSLRSGGHLFLATPFDWSGAVTPPAAWLGGHSPRAPGAGDGAWVLRSLLTPGAHPAALNSAQILGEVDDLPWTVRLHERSRSEYRLYGLAARIER